MIAPIQAKTSKRLSAKIDFNSLCSILGVQSLDDFMENLLQTCDGFWGYAYKAALEEGKNEREAEEAATEAERSEQDRIISNYRSAVVSVAEELFKKHELLLFKQDDWNYTIAPVSNWKCAANAIRETINGYGYFYFGSLKEFLDSGPYTARKAVLSHLGYISKYPEIYGNGKAKNMVERMIKD